MKKNTFLLLLALCGACAQVFAQGWGKEWSLTPDGHQIKIGQPTTGFYDSSAIRQIKFEFAMADYWTRLTTNYTTKTDLPATVYIDGVKYDSVGIRFRGQTSYSGGPGPGGGSVGEKKSFNISLDYAYDTADVDKYSTLNLLNCYLDPSFMREVIYFKMARKHIPTSKSNFAHLYINGLDWGLYCNTQQLNKRFYKEWFLTNDGTNWRADAPTGMGSPGWGDGTAALNNLGTDTSSYQPYYTLKSNTVTNPWDDLVNTCIVLDTVSDATMWDFLNNYLDVDRSLWYNATEIAYCDDDGYAYKGKMDYYVYYELETGRMHTIQYDGNSSFDVAFISTWSPFYHETNANYPLLNRLLGVPEIRQRYLAHMRTIVSDEFNSTEVDDLIDLYDSMVDSVVLADPKKIYTYTEYNNELAELKTFISSRRTSLLGNSEMNATGPTISNVGWHAAGIRWQQPTSADVVTVTANVESGNGISKVMLFYCNGVVGKFSRVQMYDDGTHNDTLAADGIYAAEIPAQSAGSWVRFYVEAASNNTAKTVTYEPAGAEHNVYIYEVNSANAVSNDVPAENIKLFPNPVSSEMYFTGIPSHNVALLTISNMLGEAVFELNQPQGNTVDVSTLSPGAYVVTFTTNTGLRQNLKFVKQ